MIARLKWYLIGGVAFAALSFVGYLLWQLASLHGDLSASEAARMQAESDKNAAVEANKANTAALQTLAWYRAIDSAKLVELNTELDAIQTKYDKKLEVREQLKKDDPDVKAFLGTPIPAALRVQSKPAAIGGDKDNR